MSQTMTSHSQSHQLFGAQPDILGGKFKVSTPDHQQYNTVVPLPSEITFNFTPY